MMRKKYIWFTNTTLVAILLITSIICVTPLFETSWAVRFFAMIKFGGLLVAAVLSYRTVLHHQTNDPKRRPWLLLTIGLSIYASGQSVLAYYQIFNNGQVPFPSFGDPLFILASFFNISALILFCIKFFRSNLPLGGSLTYWSPALIVIIASTSLAFPLLRPIVSAESDNIQRALNLYYPISSLITLAPCAVMLRVALKFRGGKLIRVWLPLTVGFSGIMISDILFSYLTSMNVQSLDPLMNFLYVASYIIIPRAILYQLELLD